MEPSQIRGSYAEDEKERHILIPRLHMDSDTIVQRLSRRLPQGRVSKGCANNGTAPSPLMDGGKRCLLITAEARADWVN